MSSAAASSLLLADSFEPTRRFVGLHQDRDQHQHQHQQQQQQQKGITPVSHMATNTSPAREPPVSYADQSSQAAPQLGQVRKKRGPKPGRKAALALAAAAAVETASVASSTTVSPNRGHKRPVGRTTSWASSEPEDTPTNSRHNDPYAFQCEPITQPIVNSGQRNFICPPRSNERAQAARHEAGPQLHHQCNIIVNNKNQHQQPQRQQPDQDIVNNGLQEQCRFRSNPTASRLLSTQTTSQTTNRISTSQSKLEQNSQQAREVMPSSSPTGLPQLLSSPTNSGSRFASNHSSNDHNNNHRQYYYSQVNNNNNYHSNSQNNNYNGQQRPSQDQQLTACNQNTRFQLREQLLARTGTTNHTAPTSAITTNDEEDETNNLNCNNFQRATRTTSPFEANTIVAQNKTVKMIAHKPQLGDSRAGQVLSGSMHQDATPQQQQYYQHHHQPVDNNQSHQSHQQVIYQAGTQLIGSNSNRNQSADQISPNYHDHQHQLHNNHTQQQQQQQQQQNQINHSHLQQQEIQHSSAPIQHQNNIQNRQSQGQLQSRQQQQQQQQQMHQNQTVAPQTTGQLQRPNQRTQGGGGTTIINQINNSSFHQQQQYAAGPTEVIHYHEEFQTIPNGQNKSQLYPGPGQMHQQQQPDYNPPPIGGQQPVHVVGVQSRIVRQQQQQHRIVHPAANGGNQQPPVRHQNHNHQTAAINQQQYVTTMPTTNQQQVKHHNHSNQPHLQSHQQQQPQPSTAGNNYHNSNYQTTTTPNHQMITDPFGEPVDQFVASSNIQSSNNSSTLLQQQLNRQPVGGVQVPQQRNQGPASAVFVDEPVPAARNQMTQRPGLYPSSKQYMTTQPGIQSQTNLVVGPPAPTLGNPTPPLTPNMIGGSSLVSSRGGMSNQEQWSSQTQHQQHGSLNSSVGPMEQHHHQFPSGAPRRQQQFTQTTVTRQQQQQQQQQHFPDQLPESGPIRTIHHPQHQGQQKPQLQPAQQATQLHLQPHNNNLIVHHPPGPPASRQAPRYQQPPATGQQPNRQQQQQQHHTLTLHRHGYNGPPSQTTTISSGPHPQHHNQIHHDPSMGARITTPPIQQAATRLTLPLRDMPLLGPFRLQHEVSYTTKVFHLSPQLFDVLNKSATACGSSQGPQPAVIQELQFRAYLSTSPAASGSCTGSHSIDTFARGAPCNWPELLQVSVNQQLVGLEPNRCEPQQRPLDVFPLCQPGDNHLGIQVNDCYCGHEFVLEAVERPTLKAFMNSCFKSRLLPVDSCLSKLKYNFGSSGFIVQNHNPHSARIDNEYITVASPQGSGSSTRAKVSLRCPLSEQRLRTPTRGHNCKHLQCFDLETFLMSNRDRRQWVCPICSIVIPFNMLELDQHQMNILAELNQQQIEMSTSDDSILMDASGQWQIFEPSLVGRPISVGNVKLSGGPPQGRMMPHSHQQIGPPPPPPPEVAPQHQQNVYRSPPPAPVNNNNNHHHHHRQTSVLAKRPHHMTAPNSGQSGPQGPQQGWSSPQHIPESAGQLPMKRMAGSPANPARRINNPSPSQPPPLKKSNLAQQQQHIGPNSHQHQITPLPVSNHSGGGQSLLLDHPPQEDLSPLAALERTAFLQEPPPPPPLQSQQQQQRQQPPVPLVDITSGGSPMRPSPTVSSPLVPPASVSSPALAAFSPTQHPLASPKASRLAPVASPLNQQRGAASMVPSCPVGDIPPQSPMTSQSVPHNSCSTPATPAGYHPMSVSGPETPGNPASVGPHLGNINGPGSASSVHPGQSPHPNHGSMMVVNSIGQQPHSGLVQPQLHQVSGGVDHQPMSNGSASAGSVASSSTTTPSNQSLGSVGMGGDSRCGTAPLSGSMGGDDIMASASAHQFGNIRPHGGCSSEHMDKMSPEAARRIAGDQHQINNNHNHHLHHNHHLASNQSGGELLGADDPTDWRHQLDRGKSEHLANFLNEPLMNKQQPQHRNLHNQQQDHKSEQDHLISDPVDQFVDFLDVNGAEDGAGLPPDDSILDLFER